MTGTRSEGVKVDRERRLRRVPKGEDYLDAESGGGPGRTHGAPRVVRLGPGSPGTEPGPRRYFDGGRFGLDCSAFAPIQKGPKFPPARQQPNWTPPLRWLCCPA